MKSADPALVALLATGRFVRADIWTIVLNGGGTVRWTSHDADIVVGGQRYVSGPVIERDQISEKTGVEVATLKVTISAELPDPEDATAPFDAINGTPLIAFIAGHGLDGASVKLERAYAPAWGSAADGPTPITGTVIRFSGKVTAVERVQGATAEVTVSSWTVLLNVKSPRNHYQVGCMRTLYDARCGVDPAAFSATGTVTTGGRSGFGSGLTAAAGYYAQGRVVFLTGANAGVSRTVKSYDGSGGFVLIKALPAPCAAGDTFKAYAGCDLSKSTCQNKFNNLTKFKGTPFVPLPTAALGAPATGGSGGKGGGGKGGL